jgi:predicted dehydrogenase
MTDKIWRTALVGCGGMGRHHMEVLADLANFKSVALCDVSEEALAAKGDEFGIDGRFTDVEKMLDAVVPDIVVVATQTRQHHEPSVAALRRGVHVLCEKPIAIDLAEADDMVDAAHKSGARLAINQQNHVNPAVVRARQMIDQGAIGDVVMVRGRNKHGRKSGNEFTEMGTHVADMMLVLGGAPEWVSGTVLWQGRPVRLADIMEAKQMSPKDRDSGPVAGDRALGQYGFANGVLGEIQFLGYEKTNSQNYGVDILGSTGQLAVRVSGNERGGLWHLPRTMEGTPADFGDWEAIELGVDPARGNTIAQMYRSFVQAIEADEEPPGSGVEGRTAFEMILGIYQSHIEGGRRVELPMAERRHPLEAWRSD